MSVTLSLPDRAVYGLTDSELMTRLDEIVACERQLAATRLEVVAELSARGVPATRGHANTTAFLRVQLKVHAPAAAQMNTLAKRLPELPDVRDALAKGTISETQAAVIAAAVSAIAPVASPATQAQAAATLISHAHTLAPKELVLCGNRILWHVAPDIAEARERREVEAKERTAWESRAFGLSPDGLGRYRLRGFTTAEGAAMLHAILDPFSKPQRQDADLDAATTDAATADTATADAADTGEALRGKSGRAGDLGATGKSGGSDAFRDRRTAAQRRHDALLDALELLLATGDLPDSGGSKPQLVVTANFDPITQRLSGGMLDNGAALSASEVRRIACDCGILPAVLDSNAVPLDLGRERRLITGGLRKALNLRDGGCSFPGCDRAPRWCQGHHCRSWADGGETNLANSVLICSFHHRLIHHDDGWTVHIGPDGHPWFTPTHGLIRNRLPGATSITAAPRLAPQPHRHPSGWRSRSRSPKCFSSASLS